MKNENVDEVHSTHVHSVKSRRKMKMLRTTADEECNPKMKIQKCEHKTKIMRKLNECA